MVIYNVYSSTVAWNTLWELIISDLVMIISLISLAQGQKYEQLSK